jgi:Lysine methyltransferase
LCVCMCVCVCVCVYVFVCACVCVCVCVCVCIMERRAIERARAPPKRPLVICRMLAIPQAHAGPVRAAAATYGAADVLATEAPGADHVLRLLRDNTAATPAVRVCELGWGADGWAAAAAVADVVPAWKPPFDVVLAADCVYERGSAVLLAETIDLACGGAGVCYLAYKERGVGEVFFEVIRARGLRCAEAAGACAVGSGGTHAVFRISRA